MSEEVKNDPKRGIKLKGADKTARIPIKVVPLEQKLKKPEWIRAKLPGKKFFEIKNILREQKMHTVCEEASCPNISECFTKGTATFMIMGDICTRRCPFCDVAHGKPLPLDPDEPRKVAETVQDMRLKYVVITSVDRDDLPDRGAAHFAATVREIKALNPECKVEILVPDFRGRVEQAVAILKQNPPDVFNHNLENVPRLYREVRPGADYHWSLELLKIFKKEFPDIPTKSGLMVGLGETNEEILEVMRDLRAQGVTMLTVGQYLQPSRHHLKVERYVPPEEFDMFRAEAEKMGFEHAACGPFVRSSYHADLQAKGEIVK